MKAVRNYIVIFSSLSMLILALFLYSGKSFAQEKEKTKEQGKYHLLKLPELPNLEDISLWERYVRGFREGINLNLSGGITRGNWQYNPPGSAKTITQSNRGVYSKFYFSRHQQIYNIFGYFLGSSLGINYESTKKDAYFRPDSSVMYPGLFGGMIINFSARFRLGIGAEVFLERFNDIKIRDYITKEESRISFTAESYDLFSSLDTFLFLNWALRVEIHKCQTYVAKPVKNSQGSKTVFDDLSLRRENFWYGIGLVYHLI